MQGGGLQQTEGLASTRYSRAEVQRDANSAAACVPLNDTALLDQFLDLVEVTVDAFAVCEIGRNHSLQCEPFDNVIVHFVLKGEGFLECDYGRLRLSPGAVAIVPRKTRKSLRGTGPIDRFDSADVSCPMSEGLVSFTATDGNADLLLGCAVLSASAGGALSIFEHISRPIVECSDDPTLKALFAVMLAELQHPRVGTRALVGAVMKQVLIVLLRSRGANDPLLLPMPDRRLGHVIANVIKRPQDAHTVDSLASAAGMSRARFSHHFSSTYQCSPKAFVQSVRLASAAKLLKGSDLPIKSVAASVGLASRSHFSRAFQARYGVPPSAYRDEASRGSDRVG